MPVGRHSSLNAYLVHEGQSFVSIAPDAYEYSRSATKSRNNAMAALESLYDVRIAMNMINATSVSSIPPTTVIMISTAVTDRLLRKSP